VAFREISPEMEPIIHEQANQFALFIFQAFNIDIYQGVIQMERIKEEVLNPKSPHRKLLLYFCCSESLAKKEELI
jgi:hypothetical protein